MAKLDQMEDKDFNETKYFDEGVHEVFITGGIRGTTESGKDFIDFNILGKEDQTGKVRMYLSEAAAPYTRKRLAAIAVHSKSGDVEKQKVRDWFKKINDTDLMDQKFIDAFKDMEAWMLAEENEQQPKPNGGYYLSYNLFSYKPTPRAKQNSTAAKAIEALGGGEITEDNLDEFPFPS